MLKFLKNVILFSAVLTLILSGMIYCFYKLGGNDLPAPKYSNSISFNEKIDFIRDKDLTKIEYIAVGSSMTLNNVDSETMVKYLGDNYLNLGSWGFKINHSKEMIQHLIQFLPNLKAVILSTNLMDFSDIKLMEININYQKVIKSIRFLPGFLSYSVDPDIRYLYENSITNPGRMSGRKSYQSLEFDFNGGVILDLMPEMISKERWSKDLSGYEVSQFEMDNVKHLNDILNEYGIGLYVVITPVRSGSMSSQDHDKYKEKIKALIKFMEVTDIGCIDCNDMTELNDSLYVDYAHLNKRGAEKFTKYFIMNLLKVK